MTDFFTSDLHFEHKNIVEFTQRHVDTAQAGHTDWLVNLWNRTVREEDTVTHLGDFCFLHKYDFLFSLLSRLNGTKVFITGNHDNPTLLREFVGNPALKVFSVKDTQFRKIGGVNTHLFHYPIGSWRSQSTGSWHIHGHSHGNYGGREVGKIIDVGLDSAYKMYGEHRFFTVEDIKKHMDSRPMVNSDTHRRSA